MRSLPSLAVGLIALACAKSPDTKSIRSDTAHGDVFASQSESVGYAVVDSIFRVHCIRCHSGTEPAHGVDLSSYERVMHGREGNGPIVTVGNPAGSTLIDILRSGSKLAPSAHTDSIGQFAAADLAALANWIGSGAQPVGSGEERLTAMLRLYVVALAVAEQGFYAWRKRYTTSFDSLRVIPVGGVKIAFVRADTGRWEASITHPQLREKCVVSGHSRAPVKPLDLTTAAQFCSSDQ
ncbi:MAG: c-type cytochrome domain-containing protein [Gemmatimonadaceae bacterium]